MLKLNLKLSRKFLRTRMCVSRGGRGLHTIVARSAGFHKPLGKQTGINLVDTFIKEEFVASYILERLDT